MMELYQLKEQEYFSLTEKERTDIAKTIVKRVRQHDRLGLTYLYDNLIIPLLEEEYEKALEEEAYMLCDAIKRIMKEYNETTL
jgi:hypothetical protein